MLPGAQSFSAPGAGNDRRTGRTGKRSEAAGMIEMRFCTENVFNVARTETKLADVVENSGRSLR